MPVYRTSAVEHAEAVAVAARTDVGLSREHNDINVLALGERITDINTARRIVELFLDTPFAGGRHQARIDKISALDKKTQD